jgi:hypothetical protein
LDSEELISLAEAAVLSGLTPRHLNHLARAGQLPARKIGRNWVTTRTAVEDYSRDSFKRSRDPLKNRR